MAVTITRAGHAPSYSPPLHDGVDAVRLQGLEAGATERFWVGMSVYRPGGTAGPAPTAEETVYVVLDGELTLTVDGTETTLGAEDSVHLPKGTGRLLENRTGTPAKLLVIIAVGQS